MYPSDAKELTALIAALSPLIIWASSNLVSSRARSQEASLARWRRINELSLVLYNKEKQHGLWAQIAAVHELAETKGDHRTAARTILVDAQKHYKDNVELTEATKEALVRFDRCWIKRLAGL